VSRIDHASQNRLRQSSKDGRGREAQSPGEIPPKGWIDVARRTWNEVSDANLFLVAGGVTYAILSALFPGLAALISIYGLMLDPSQIERQVGTPLRNSSSAPVV
jgi:membrane protein